jgi:DNA repair protein RadC
MSPRSESDKLTTLDMKRHLDLINVNWVDHIIVAGTEARSLVKEGDL